MRISPKYAVPANPVDAFPFMDDVSDELEYLAEMRAVLAATTEPEDFMG